MNTSNHIGNNAELRCSEKLMCFFVSPNLCFTIEIL